MRADKGMRMDVILFIVFPGPLEAVVDMLLEHHTG